MLSGASAAKYNHAMFDELKRIIGELTVQLEILNKAQGLLGK